MEVVAAGRPDGPAADVVSGVCVGRGSNVIEADNAVGGGRWGSGGDHRLEGVVLGHGGSRGARVEPCLVLRVHGLGKEVISIHFRTREGRFTGGDASAWGRSTFIMLGAAVEVEGRDGKE